MRKIIDISVGLEKETPIWPDSNGIDFKQSSNINKGDLANVTSIKLDVHVGTHIENSLHFIKDGDNVNKIDFELLIGKAVVVYLPEVKTITASDLEKLNLDKNVERILLKTRNSQLWKKREKQFRKDYVGIDVSGAFWIAKSNIKLIGIDYLSIAKFDETVKVHQILLKNKIIILETLDLSGVDSGTYQLICLPLKLLAVEAAPARAILIPL